VIGRCKRRPYRLVPRHFVGRFQGAAADEDGQASEQRLLGGGEQVVAPGDRLLERPLARRRVPRPGREQVEGREAVRPLGRRAVPADQPGQRGPRRQDLASGSRQLDREGQAVQPDAELGHCSGILAGEREVGLDRPGTLDEQRHGRHLGQRGGIPEVLGPRQFERGERELVLAVDAQRLAAGDQHLQPGAAGEQVADQRRRRDHVLEIVEEQKHLPLAEMRTKSLDQRHGLGLADPELVGYGRDDLLGVAHGCQRDEEDAVGEPIEERPRDLEAEARLADPGRADHGQQAHVGARKPPPQLGRLALPAHEAAQRGRQGVPPRAARQEPWASRHHIGGRPPDANRNPRAVTPVSHVVPRSKRALPVSPGGPCRWRPWRHVNPLAQRSVCTRGRPNRPAGFARCPSPTHQRAGSDPGVGLRFFVPERAQYRCSHTLATIGSQPRHGAMRTRHRAWRTSTWPSRLAMMTAGQGWSQRVSMTFPSTYSSSLPPISEAPASTVPGQTASERPGDSRRARSPYAAIRVRSCARVSLRSAWRSTSVPRIRRRIHGARRG
jgi:hypothetical protein